MSRFIPMTVEEIAAQMGLSRGRVWQIECAALAKMHVLLMGDALDRGQIENPAELRLLVAHARNALRHLPLHPERVRV